MAATRKIDQSKLMLEAGRSGNQARQQSANRAENARQFDEQVDQQNLNRWQRQWEEKRANELAKDQLTTQRESMGLSANPDWTPSSILDQRAQLQQEEMQRGAMQQAATAQEAAGQREQQQLDLQKEQLGLQRDELSLRGAAQGFEQQDPRLRDLMGEMERGGEQMRQGLESTGQGKKWIPTEQSKKSAEQAAAAQQYDAESRRINAVANYQRAANEYQIAEMRMASAGTASARATDEAAVKELDKTLLQPVKTGADRLNRLDSFKGTDKDWRELGAMIDNGDNPLAGDLATMKAEIQDRNWTPRLRQFVSEGVAAKAINYIQATGKMPEGELVDMSSETMQTFVRNTKIASTLLGFSGTPTIAGQLLSAGDRVQQIKWTNKFAAGLTMQGKPTMPMQDGNQPQQPQEQGFPTPATPGAFEQHQASKPNEQRADPTGFVPPGGQQPYRGATKDIENPTRPYKPPKRPSGMVFGGK